MESDNNSNSFCWAQSKQTAVSYWFSTHCSNICIYLCTYVCTQADCYDIEWVSNDRLDGWTSLWVQPTFGQIKCTPYCTACSRDSLMIAALTGDVYFFVPWLSVQNSGPKHCSAICVYDSLLVEWHQESMQCNAILDLLECALKINTISLIAMPEWWYRRCLINIDWTCIFSVSLSPSWLFFSLSYRDIQQAAGKRQQNINTNIDTLS